VNENEREPLGSEPGPDHPHPKQTVGGAPRPVEPVAFAPPANLMPEPGLPPPPAQRRTDQQVGKAPGADERVGTAPPTGGNKNVALFVGAAVVVLAIIALIFGVVR
jgi:hypothetical protein